MVTKAEAKEFARILKYFQEHGVYPEDAKPKMLTAVIGFEKERAQLAEKETMGNAKERK